MVDGETILQHGKPRASMGTSSSTDRPKAHARIEPLITDRSATSSGCVPAYERIYRRCEKVAISPDTYRRFDH